ncbi:MAG: PHP-associated domain-containing protein [Eubacterium sp.]
MTDIQALRSKYPYLYETHLHTSEASACARSTGKEMAQACKDAGYTGIIVTNHNWHGNHCIDRSLSWEMWIREYCRGYEEAKKWGDKIGLDVFFGYESGYQGTEFLIYGITMEWLIAHPEIENASVERQYQLIHDADGMVIHAHPFREEPYIPEIRLFPEYVDGVEGINATHSSPLSQSHNDPAFDARAIAYANEHHLPMTAGSDVHSTALFGGGVAFRKKLKNIHDYCNAIFSGEDYILTNGKNWYTKGGKKIC